jgi:hypothetical protein
LKLLTRVNATEATSLKTIQFKNRMGRNALVLIALATLWACATPVAPSRTGAKTAIAHYILIYPGSTLETDFGGRCVRIDNGSAGNVYLVATSADEFEKSLNAFQHVLKVEDCSGK